MWFSKRLMGGLNMLLFRRHIMRNEFMPILVEHIIEQKPHAVIITGDLSTTSLDGEFALLRQFLQPLMQQIPIITIPGNHDIYTANAERQQRYQKYFIDCHGPNGNGSSSSYPFVREIGEKLVCIGLNSAVPTGLHGSWGMIDDSQLSKLSNILNSYVDRFRVVLLHHFLLDVHGHHGLPNRGLRNRDRLLAILANCGAEMILHGHEHACYRYHVLGDQAEIPVFIPGPATLYRPKHKDQGGYQIYEIDDGQLQKVWRFNLNPQTLKLEPQPLL
jgi:3',5'-cyclic AMP phosphodiesterase CpdA